MCLLVVVSRLDPAAPLIVAANRDERLERPARPMDVLRGSNPRILGGRDLEAGGTWLAVNEHGVVAGITNRPTPGGRDPSKRTRGELPLALAGHRDAASAVADFTRRFEPGDYNPAWFLVGDRRSLYALDMTAGHEPPVQILAPGVHILENNPLHPPSAKVNHIRRLLGTTRGVSSDILVEQLRTVLADHSIPPTPPRWPPRRRETLAACVHTTDYGTRSSTVIRVQAAPSTAPEVAYTDGPPCTAPFIDASALWAPVAP